mmetsp:Transcript_33197/g.104424  ORF Transcript_33197/g.104424 Transcript_33197/m.104424 type:complete len:205 (-) Transcript_33197:331-945(-)
MLKKALPLQPRDDRRDQRRVEASREEDSVWHVRHEPFLDGGGEGGSQLLQVEGLGRGGGRVPRGRVIRHQPPLLLAATREVVVAGGKDAHVDAAARDERLGLGREPGGAVQAGAHVERVYAHGVARRVDVAGPVVENHKRKVTVELRGDVDAELVVAVDDHLAVRLGAERRRVLELRSQLLVVVDLAVDGQRARSVMRKERLVP